LSKDLLARALCHQLQEEELGGLPPRLAKLLADIGKTGVERSRHVKVGSILVREHKGELHEVMVAPDGFCWRGKTYASLSSIAKKITGVSWNGFRFFGLQAAAETSASAESAPAAAPIAANRNTRPGDARPADPSITPARTTRPQGPACGQGHARAPEL